MDKFDEMAKKLEGFLVHLLLIMLVGGAAAVVGSTLFGFAIKVWKVML